MEMETATKSDFGPQDVSFVIVTYNSSATIEHCIRSVLAQETEPREIIVVDNASSDATLSIIKSRFAKVSIVRNATNDGYGSANNVGVARARSVWVAIINPDAYLRPTWTSEMLSFMVANPCFAAAEGKLLLAKDPRFLNSAGSSLNLLGFGITRDYGRADSNEGKPSVAAYPSGASFIVRKEAFQSVGGFDEDYFLYHDDVDLGLRLRSIGWHVGYVPSAVAEHDYKDALTPEKLRWLEANRWRTLLKCMPDGYFYRTLPLHAVAEPAICLFLLRRGLLRAKCRSIIHVLRHLGQIMATRAKWAREANAVKLTNMLTDEFPSLVREETAFVRFGEKLLRRYRSAFLSPISELADRHP